MLKIRITLFLLSTLLIFGCSRYQRLLKSDDYNEKYDAAIEYYEKGKYEKALPFLEELTPLYRGTEKAEKIYYYYCYANYKLDYLFEAGYHFKKFSTTFPSSKFVEETFFMSGYCKYRLSPLSSLDPTDTYAAIDELQSFINTYPQHQLLDSANLLIDKLRTKLEDKSFNNAKQYYQIYEYKAAIIALNNVLREFPDTKYAEEVAYLLVKSHYFLAYNSVKEKKLERFDDTIDAYRNFVDLYKQSKYIKSVEVYYNKAIEQKNKITKENL
ncbi:MAG: outer membrane protein assembly factor BamD [Flavobacteriales bacterium]|nr:outer membrane protein assembly factor BamD [Flavobacteriales bacterium]